MIEDRLIDLTFQVRSGKYDEVIRVAQSRGYETEFENGVLYLRKDDFVTGVSHEAGDPTSTFVCLATAFFGPYWAILMPNALRKVDEQWKKERKKGGEMK